MFLSLFRANQRTKCKHAKYNITGSYVHTKQELHNNTIESQYVRKGTPPYM